MMESRGVELNYSLLGTAASSGMRNKFETALDALQGVIGEEEIQLTPCTATLVLVPQILRLLHSSAAREPSRHC